VVDYLAQIDQLADEYGIPREQARAIYQIESSSGRNTRTSSKGARGQMQLMPGTARDMGVTNIDDPLQNIRGGVKYYGQQLRAFGDPVLAAAAYNAGPGAVSKAGGVPNFAQTKAYVAQFRDIIDAARSMQPNMTNDLEPATVPQTRGANPMDEEINPEAETAGGGLGVEDVYAPQGGNFAKLNEMFRVLRSQQAAGIARREATAADQYAAAQKRLERRYGGPSTSDMLMRMSQAMLSQRRTPGFAGALGQIVGSLNETNDAARAAQMQREDMLAELQSQYSTGQMTREVAGERSAAELFKIYAAMNKPQADASRRLVAGPNNSLFDAITGQEIRPVSTEAFRKMEDFFSSNPDQAAIKTAVFNFESAHGIGSAARNFERIFPQLFGER